MTASSSIIPVAWEPQAVARVAELGLSGEVQRMIEYAFRNLPDVHRIEVILNERYDLGGDPGVTVEALADRPYDPADRISQRLMEWELENFPPPVLEHLHMSYIRGAVNER